LEFLPVVATLQASTRLFALRFSKGTRVHGHEFVGFVGGYKGLCEADIMPLTRHEVKGIGNTGGTIIGTSRTNPFDYGGVPERFGKFLMSTALTPSSPLVAKAALLRRKNSATVACRWWVFPKTVDNDLNGTDYTFGFDTAVSIATEAMDRLRTTGDSHSRGAWLQK
jgi:ATP-dependent phosphofructokinase / diphosphate-dependent phosphofructokinase